MTSFFDRIKTAAETAGTTASSAQDKVLQEYLPKIASILRDKAGPAVLDIFSDAERLSGIAGTVYQALPMPVRLVVKEQNFVDWIISYKEPLVEALKSQLPIVDALNPELVASTLPPSACNLSSIASQEETQEISITD